MPRRRIFIKCSNDRKMRLDCCAPLGSIISSVQLSVLLLSQAIYLNFRFPSGSFYLLRGEGGRISTPQVVGKHQTLSPHPILLPLGRRAAPAVRACHVQCPLWRDSYFSEIHYMEASFSFKFDKKWRVELIRRVLLFVQERFWPRAISSNFTQGRYRQGRVCEWARVCLRATLPTGDLSKGEFVNGRVSRTAISG